MTMFGWRNLESLESKIKTACLTKKSKGWTIQASAWLLPDKKCCCPLVALAMVEGLIHGSEICLVEEEVAWALMLSELQVLAFTTGFDGSDPFNNYSKENSYYQLGCKIRQWVDQGMP